MTRDQVSVCVCTFKRPELLERLLDGLAQQVSDRRFTIEIVVVDNDSQRVAEAQVEAFAQRVSIATVYDCEPERNISLARNRAVRIARGNLVAFVDDDERPVQDWLSQLYRALGEYNADGVLGPVVPDYPSTAPAWLKRGRFFDRRRLPTGARIGASDARTGNVLLRRSIFSDDGCWFNPEFGRTGGEDTDFFTRQFQAGATFVWCDEAPVYEIVPPERWKSSFHLKRLLRAGTVDGERMRAGTLDGKGAVAKNIVLLLTGAVLVVPSFALPKHLWMRLAQKVAYCGGLVSAYFGLSLLRHRD